MKDFFIRALKWKLKKLAQWTIVRYRPGIVGITGSVGKTSTKRAVAAVLGSEREVRASGGNFSNELGLPLTILGSWDRVGGIFFWVRVFLATIFRLIVKSHYPEILVLEYGVDRPGDMKYLLEIARPNVSVITAVGEVPVHVEFFNGPEEVAREKGRIIECLPTAGYAILNADDKVAAGLRPRTRAQIMTYGTGKDAAVRVSNIENKSENGLPIGVSFKIEYGGSFVPVRLDGVFGKAQGYAAGAATCVGLIFGLNLVKISEALNAHYLPAPHRMELVPGVKYTHIIDDSYNASPLSMRAALETVKEIPAKRKIGVLGDMLEIGRYAMEEHEKIGALAASVLDQLVCVGPRAKFIAEGARKAGFPRKNIQMFDVVEDARSPVQSLIKKGDLILVKASREIHLDEVIEEIRAF
ncbi:MAG: UDP-N-acetylmuramoyl-tripeptide--D-alanyl-D-alanine ligase [Patescibacteria group bacterium]